MVLGTSSVGKSSLCMKYVQNYYTGEYEPTDEDYYRKIVTIDKKEVMLDIVDTTGAEIDPSRF